MKSFLGFLARLKPRQPESRPIELIMAIVAIASLAFAAIPVYDSYFKQKSLNFEIESISPLFNNETNRSISGLNILYNNEQVQNFTLIRLRFKNSGGIPITSNDFETDLRVVIDGAQKVHFARIREATPPSLLPIIKQHEHQGNVFHVAPLLLNPGDSFIIEAGVNLDKAEIGIHKINAYSRVNNIANITKISNIDKSETNPLRMYLSAGLVLFIYASIAAIIIMHRQTIRRLNQAHAIEIEKLLESEQALRKLEVERALAREAELRLREAHNTLRFNVSPTSSEKIDLRRAVEEAIARTMEQFKEPECQSRNAQSEKPTSPPVIGETHNT